MPLEEVVAVSKVRFDFDILAKQYENSRVNSILNQVWKPGTHLSM